MILGSYLCLLSIHVYRSLTMASDNFTKIEVQHVGGNALGLSCRITNTQNSRLIVLFIFEDTPKNILVTLYNGECPIVKASARAKHIYLRQGDPKDEIHSLDILVLNYNPADSLGFGCNYTYIAEAKYIRHSLSFVYTSDITSIGEVNQTNTTSVLQGCPEAKKGPPRCPTHFTVVGADLHSVRLSWRPGFDGGLKQTFTVLRIDIPRDTSSSSPGLMVLGTVEAQGEDNVYEVTGLSESTMYTFALEATNEKGSGNCSHLQVTVSTSASSAVVIDGNVTIINVVPVVVVAVLFIFVIVVVVMMIKRRRAYVNTKPVNAADIPLSGTGETSRVAYINCHEDDYLCPMSRTAPENPDTRNHVPLYEEIDDVRLKENSAKKSYYYQNVKC